MSRTTKQEAQEISAHNIISADSIFNRFKYIFEPLMERAQSNFEELSSKITTLKAQYRIQIKQPYFSFKNGNSVITAFNNLASEIKTLEKTWNDIVGYNPTSKAWANKNPLHVIKSTDYENNKLTYRAGGRVRPYDFIGAYHFKGFVESLYAVAADLRNLALRVHINDELSPNNNNGLSFGKFDKFASYNDINYIDANTVTELSIFPHQRTDPSSCAIYSFTDYILNNNTNGEQIFTYDELINSNFEEISNTIFHGYVGEESLIPAAPIDISTKLNTSNYLNTNFITELSSDYGSSFFGHQTVNHLQKASVAPSGNIQSYYNMPPRTGPEAEEFDYTSNPSSGIAHEYIRLKPAKQYNHSLTIKNKLKQWTEISSNLKKYFSPTAAGNKIVSKSYYGEDRSGQIISAKTVDNLFRELNVAAATISSILCGEYNMYFIVGALQREKPPLHGLGYPEIFSWYYGTTNESTSLNNNLSKVTYEDWRTNDIAYYTPGNHDELRDRKGNLSNGNQLATEDYIRNNVIRAGLFYLNTETSITLNDFKNLLQASHSSVIPMTYSRFYVRPGNRPEDIISCGTMPSTSSDFKYQMLFNVENSVSNNTVKIYSKALTNPLQQIFNRYCISRPYDIETYNDNITSNNPEYNINTKYIFMPYMTWMSKMIKEPFKVYNGKIPIYSTTPTSQKEVEISSMARYLNNAAGLPVSIEDRNMLWDSSQITSVPTLTPSTASEISIYRPNINSKFGAAQVQLYYYDNKQEKIVQVSSQNNIYSTVEYNLLAGVTVNEVNHTHSGSGYTNLYLYPNGSTTALISTSIRTNYDDRTTDDGDVSYEGETTITNDISSTIFNGLNTYKNTNAETSCYLNNTTDDMMRSLYGNAFLFNDFYRDNNPLARNYIEKQDIAPYFTTGKYNDFVEGNASKVISWNVEISSNVTPPDFRLQQFFKHKKDTFEGSPNLIQGNFFCSGNHSNKLKQYTNVELTKISSYYYRFIPQPSPIIASKVEITNDARFTMEGTCKYLWNDLAKVRVNLVHYNGDTLPSGTRNCHYKTITLINKEHNYSPAAIITPYKNFIPVTSSYHLVREDAQETTAVTVSYNSTSKEYKFNINFELTQNDLTALDIDASNISQISCTLRFINENTGFRDVCNNKYYCSDTEQGRDDDSPMRVGYFKVKTPL